MARGFVFRLQPVLEQRERLEEQAQLRVAALERERLLGESVLRSIQAELLDTRRHLRAGLHPTSQAVAGMSPDAPARPGLAGVRAAASASLHLAVRAQRAAMELAGTLKRLDSARAELLKVTADRKAVQLLKDRALEAFRREQLKREAAALDELVVMRHGRTVSMVALPGRGVDRSDES